jgi:hypothetical protein
MIGYQRPVKNNDIGYYFDKRCCKSVQTGKGYADILSTLNTLYSGSKMVKDFVFGEPGTLIRNVYGKIANNNDKWRELLPGEKHAINSRGVSYNFLGPGTRLDIRLPRGDEGLDPIDEIAKKHDIAYHNAQGWDDIRKADEVFIKNLDSIKGQKKLKKLVKGLFKMKLIGEDYQLIRKDQFTDFENLRDTKKIFDYAAEKISDKLENAEEIKPQQQENIIGNGKKRKKFDPARKLRKKFKY